VGTERGAELGLLMQIVNECGKVTIAEGWGIKNNTDAPAIKQKDLNKIGKGRPMWTSGRWRGGEGKGIGEWGGEVPSSSR